MTSYLVRCKLIAIIKVTGNINIKWPAEPRQSPASFDTTASQPGK